MSAAHKTFIVEELDDVLEHFGREQRFYAPRYDKAEPLEIPTAALTNVIELLEGQLEAEIQRYRRLSESSHARRRQSARRVMDYAAALRPLLVAELEHIRRFTENMGKAS